MHDIVGVSITVATILVATFFSSQSVNGLRTEMNTVRSDVMSRFDSIQKDMREFYADRALQGLRISNLEQQKN